MFQWLWVRILAPYTGWIFFTYIFCKNCNDVCLKRPKYTKKGRGWPIFFKKSITIQLVSSLIDLDSIALLCTNNKIFSFLDKSFPYGECFLTLGTNDVI